MFEVGELVVDETKQRLGEVMEIGPDSNRGRWISLRPPKGGREWEVQADFCRTPKADELVSADALRHVEAPS